MAKLFDIRFDAETSEIETGYKAFQNRYLLRKKVLYTVVYVIIIVLGVDLIIKIPRVSPDISRRALRSEYCCSTG